jgi:cell division protein ZapA (FtsZ GTPase activity inhibitor)
MKNSGIKVKIFNSDYNLLGENPQEVERYAKYVDMIMQRINFQSPNTSAESIAVVTALNISESYFKEKDMRADIEQSYLESLKTCTERFDSLSKLIDNSL